MKKVKSGHLTTSSNTTDVCTVPHMETIDGTAKIFGLPRHSVRKSVLEGKVVYVKSGRKYLVNVQKFAEWLNTGESPPHAATPARTADYGTIRPVPERVR